MGLLINTPRIVEALRKADAYTLQKSEVTVEQQSLTQNDFIGAQDIKKANTVEVPTEQSLIGDFVCTIQESYDVWNVTCSATYDSNLAGRAYYNGQVIEVPKFFKAFDFIPDVRSIDIIFTAEMNENGEVQLYENGIRLGALGGTSFMPGRYVEKICTLVQIQYDDGEEHPKWTVTERRLGGPIIIRGLW